MNADLVGTSLTVHGAICAAAVLGIWKLGGESKFGTEKVADLHALRPKLLKELVGALELSLKPILTASSATEAFEIDDNGNAKPMPARLAVSGKEALTNAVRDFVKSDSRGLLDLREAKTLELRLNQSLDRLRRLVWAILATSGLACGLMVIGKCEWLTLTAPWIHAVAFAISALLISGVVALFGRILNASSLVDRLKSRYADLS